MSFPRHPPFCIFAQKRNIMAITINTTFSSIHLSSTLPEEISITTDQECLEVSVYVNSSKVFSSVYYPYNQEIIVRDIRSIVETSMSEAKRIIATLKIEAKGTDTVMEDVTYDEDGNIHVSFGSDTSSPAVVSSDDITVIFCRYKTILSSETFLSDHFLTTQKSAVIPRNGSMKLSYFSSQRENNSISARIYYSLLTNPNQILSIDSFLRTTPSENDSISTVILSHAYLKSLVERVTNSTNKIYGVEYHVGARQFNLFFTDEQPSDTFNFLNVFNHLDTAYIFAATTTKTEIDHSEAVCGRHTQYYDESVKVKHEVETSPLTPQEASWLSEMLLSKYVTRQIDSFTSAQVLISDISSEVSNSDKELIRLKFSWKYADGSNWL